MLQFRNQFMNCMTQKYYLFVGASSHGMGCVFKQEDKKVFYAQWYIILEIIKTMKKIMQLPNWSIWI